MTKEEIDALVNKYQYEMKTDSSWFGYSTQYDDRSAAINYSLIRENKPKCVVEFGTRTGRCSCDTISALMMNGKSFLYKPYELDYGLRLATQAHLKIKLGIDIKVGGDIMEATDLPDDIDYLFVDNFHDEKVTMWLFDCLLPRCIPGAIVQIHDLPLMGDFQVGKTQSLPETDFIISLHQQGKLPLQKMYWTFEEGGAMESTWWIYKPI